MVSELISQKKQFLVPCKKGITNGFQKELPFSENKMTQYVLQSKTRDFERL